MSFKSVASAVLTVGGASVNVALPGAFIQDKSGNSPFQIQVASDLRLQLDNADTAQVYWKIGRDSSVTATASDTLLRPGAIETFRFEGEELYIAAICPGGTSHLQVNVGRET